MKRNTEVREHRNVRRWRKIYAGFSHVEGWLPYEEAKAVAIRIAECAPEVAVAESTPIPEEMH